MRGRLVCALVALALLSLPAVAQTPAPGGGTLGFYRFPALHGDVVVFAAEGDLWRVSTSGGVAQRLTTHPGEERLPRISPDGRTLAFSAQYEGPTEVYTMPLAGGLPARWTYESEPSRVTTWTPGGELVYTTTAFATLPQNQLVKVDLEANSRERVPLFTATEGSFDATGRTLYFVRPADHNNVTKRYVGGTARDVWKFTEGDAEAVELTGDYEGESHSPMWWEGRVYFVTDRDGTMNLWSMDENGGDVRQHTRHSGWDVKNPDLDGGRIVYQLGADLRLLDVATGQDEGISIGLASDFDQLREKWVDEPMQYLTSAHLDTEGERVVLTARGRVFVAPVGAGRMVRASTKEGVRYRDVTFLPSGELIGLSDETGEFEWVTMPATGVGAERALTDDGAVLRYEGVASPDGSKFAYTDHQRRIWVLDVESGSQRVVTEHQEGAGEPAWSPDSRWLAFIEGALNTFTQVKLYDTQTESVTHVTSDRVNSQSPTWSEDGDFLYFLSDRNLRSLVGSPWGSRQPEPYFDEPWEIYEVALERGLRSPFRPADELVADNGEDDEAEGVVTVDIDLDGLQMRARRVPVPSGNYRSLAANASALFFMARQAGQFGGGTLKAVGIDNEDPEVVDVAEGVSSYELSGNGKKLLVRQGANLAVIDARPAKANGLADARVDLSDWAFSMDVREDFRQLYVDALRMERDYFYDPGMHGVDWDGVTEKYMGLLDRVTTRDELSDLIGRAVGELSALHTSVRGGDMRSGDDNVSVASLGARLIRDPGAGGYRIDYVYQSDPDYPEEMSPLADPYLDIHAGDVIEAVNGVSTLDVPHIGALLRNQAGKQVRLRVRPASGGTPRDAIVTAMGSESGLRYSDWEYTRRLEVEEDSDGTIGYVHMRAMGGGNLTEWYRQFYPVFNRQGLIIDMRHNRGGNIDSFILEKLMRQAWMYWKENAGEPSWNMQYAFRGHMVMLVDQTTASDGEAVADGFRRLGLGPVIGMRTWGGEIWLGSSNRLTDGGLARAPSMGVYGPEGEWLIEQIGVVPDIVVDNLPHATFNGEDAQLDAAIRYLQQKIAEDPRLVPEAPPYPNRGYRYRATDGRGSGGEGRRER